MVRASHSICRRHEHLRQVGPQLTASAAILLDAHRRCHGRLSAFRLHPALRRRLVLRRLTHNPGRLDEPKDVALADRIGASQLDQTQSRFTRVTAEVSGNE